MFCAALVYAPPASGFTGFSVGSPSHRWSVRTGSHITPMNDIGKRIGRLGKEKFGEAGDWINEAAKSDGPNLRCASLRVVFEFVSSISINRNAVDIYLSSFLSRLAIPCIANMFLFDR